MDKGEWALVVFNTQDLAECRATCRLEKKKKKKSSNPVFNKLDFSALSLTTCRESRSGARAV